MLMKLTPICYDFKQHLQKSNDGEYNTGVPRFMREIGTPKICSHIINSHIKRPTITVN